MAFNQPLSDFGDILVVDDEASVVEVVCLYLQREGFAVRVARDGRAALRYLTPYIFRVAISNRRILKLADGKVSFRYFASETGKPRTCP